MGNAGSNNMHRERHKSSDLSTPNSPFRELPSSTRDSVISHRSVDVNVSGGGSGGGGAAQAFTFDKKPDTRSVLNGGSSQEDEEQPYYTKPVGSAVIASTATVAESDFPATLDNKRKRTRTVSAGTTSSVSQMSAKDSIEFNEDGDERAEDTVGSQVELSTENNNPALPTVLRWDGGGRNVMISGTFSKWKPIPMVRSHGNFVTIIDLPMGDHQYKFCVDGEWKHDPKLVSTLKPSSYITVRKIDKDCA